MILVFQIYAPALPQKGWSLGLAIDRVWRFDRPIVVNSVQWLFLSGALCCAGFVQGLSGFGFGLVSMCLLPLFMEIKEAAVISTAFTLVSTAITFARYYREYQWRLGTGFLVSVCVGLPLGVLFLERSSEHLLARILGALMLSYAGRELLLGKRNEPLPRVCTVPLGIFSGAMSGAFNLGGVPSAAYAYSQPWSRGQIMSFLQVMISISCVLRLVFYSNAGLLQRISWTQALLLVIPLFGTIWFGNWVLKRAHPARMRQIIFVFIALAGFYYLFLH